tara:strand:- start:3277 stop:5178 length:1902 start_codon:yes stop_codon:yes gene_type:complete
MNDISNKIKWAIEKADIPILLMVLYHFTGDKKWLNPPFKPVLDFSFFAHESGGLDSALQSQVRSAALELLNKFFVSGKLPDLKISDETYLEMMSTCVGEDVPEEYLNMMLEEMQLKERYGSWKEKPDNNTLTTKNVIIIGAGVSGMLMGVKLREAGIPFVIIEKNNDIGGTWFENTYPGVRCDVPNHYYSFSFERNNKWPNYYSYGEDIAEYLRSFATKHGVYENTIFNTRVTACKLNNSNNTWCITTVDNEGKEVELLAHTVISATGQLNIPAYPRIEGLENFEGFSTHTAKWNKNINLKGKNVGVIGTGASGMQLIPEIVDEVKCLSIFQRTAQWAIPSPDYHREVSTEKVWLLENVPFYAGWYRFNLAWRMGDHLLHTVRRDPEWESGGKSVNKRNDRHRQRLLEYIKKQIGDRTDLLEKVVPSYPPYLKRILVDNRWYETIKKDNVNLFNDSIKKIEKNGIRIKSGELIQLDALLYATGFQTNRLLASYELIGKDGANLEDEWGKDDSRAYLGMTIPGFPNFFALYGPNTNLGHGGSIIFIAECQVRYLTKLLMHSIENNVNSLECKRSVYDQYNKKLDEEHEGLIWTTPNMNTWYRNSSGRVVSIMPWRLVDYWTMTQEPSLDDYNIG